MTKQKKQKTLLPVLDVEQELKDRLVKESKRTNEKMSVIRRRALRAYLQ